MFPKSKRRRIILAIIISFVLLLVCAAVLLNPALTRYVESVAFRDAIGKETAKGLHLGSGRYQTIQRSGLFTASSAGFEGAEGRKAIVTMTARDITVKFNPWGILLRRWQLGDVHINSGDVEIHTYEPKPEPAPPKPWYSFFLPDRVYLKQVVCDTANVTWQFRGRKSGFFGTRLLITPHGRDFEYHAGGGSFRMALVPDLKLRAVHVLITKELLTLYNLDLAPVEQGDGSIHVEGRAGLKEDKSIDAEMTFSAMPIAAWLPDSWRGHFTGVASGNAHWSGKNTKLETSSGHGTLRLEHGSIFNLPFLQKLVSITGKKSLETLNPGECSLNVEWNYPKIEFKKIAIEERGKFRIEGGFAIDNKALGGVIRLGVAPEYLEWLPDAGRIFTPGEGNYSWVTIHLSGTVEKPRQDLSPRIMGMLEEHPGELLEFLFRELRESLGRVFDDQ